MSKSSASQADVMRERQRQLQAIIAHAAKKAGMDKPALQEVARLNPGLKKAIPQIVQASSRSHASIEETIRKIAELLMKAAYKHNIRLYKARK